MKPRMPITPSARLVGALLCACPLAAAGLLAQSTQASTRTRAVAVASGAPDLHVSGNGLFTAHGRRVVLHGVNRPGGQSECVHGHGIWDGPMDQASVTAMKSWGVNAVRVPLNEACWNGELRRQLDRPVDEVARRPVSGGGFRALSRREAALRGKNGAADKRLLK